MPLFGLIYMWVVVVVAFIACVGWLYIVIINYLKNRRLLEQDNETNLEIQNIL